MIKNSSTALLLTAAVASTASAAVTVQQSTFFQDGNNTAVSPAASIPFDVVNTGSILVVGIYVDNTATAYDFTTLNFGGIAPDASYTDGRLQSFLFLNPSTDSGLSFDYSKVNAGTATPNTSGIGIILYEVSGANASLSFITSSTNSNAIETTTANESIVSFAGRNNTTAPTENTLLFNGTDRVANFMVGGGSIASASAIAGTIGSQDITWNNATDGRIAFAFEAAPAVPEPSSLVLVTLGSLVVLRRRCA